jgi:hypothetical protein
MNSFNFTRTHIKNKKPVNYGTNKMGQYYTNQRVPIKNYNTTPIAARIDKNMTNLNVPENLTNKNLTSFIDPLIPIPVEKEEESIFNFTYENADSLNDCITPVLINDEPKLVKEDSISIFNYTYDNVDNLNSFINPILKDTPKIFKQETVSIFNYTYDNVTSNLGEQIKEFEIKEQSLISKLDNTDINEKSHMNLKTDEKHFNTFVAALNNDDLVEKYEEHEIELYKNKSYTKSLIKKALKILQLTKVIIENVYQKKYNNNKINATGLGDFFRGSYFLMNFCDKNQLFYNINMSNHPVSQFLEIYQNKKQQQQQNPLSISMFTENNFNPLILNNNVISNEYDYRTENDFISFLHQQRMYNRKIQTYVISYPNILIEDKHKRYMQHILKPTQHLSLLVDEQLTKLGIFGKEYIIIHVRYGDKYLINNDSEICLPHLNAIQLTINSLEPSQHQNILLVSDNMIIKKLLTATYPHIKTHFNEITHTGEGIQIDTNKLQNTMIDLYLFSRAKRVIAFSVYKHGTGFSKWITETYSVPYVCHFLQ